MDIMDTLTITILGVCCFCIGLFLGLHESTDTIAKQFCKDVYNAEFYHYSNSKIYCLVDGKYLSPYKPVDQDSNKGE